MRKIFKKIVTVVVVFAVLICSFSTSYANETSVSKQPTANQELGISSSSSNDTSGYIPTPVYNEDFNSKVSANQTRNIRCLVYTIAPINTIGNITVNYTSPLDFHVFIPKVVSDNHFVSLVSYSDSEIVINYIMNSSSCPVNTLLFELRFNLPGEQSTIPNISIADSEIGNKLILGTYFIGDVDGDNNISSSDALLVNQASSGSVTLNATQQIKADVDCNGAVGSSDALLILQYSTNRVLSFWLVDSIIALPTGQNSQIISGNTYAIKGAATHYFWSQYPTNPEISNTREIKQKIKNPETKYQKFQFIYDSDYGAYLIRATYTDAANAEQTKLLGVETSKKIQLMDNVISDNTLWYIISNSGNYIFINKAYPDELISPNSNSNNQTLYSTKNIHSCKWELIPEKTITVKSFYDKAFELRHDWVGNNASGLVAIHNDVHSIFYDLLGVELIFAQPTQYTSICDKCMEMWNISSSDTDAYINTACSGDSVASHIHGTYGDVLSTPIVCTDILAIKKSFMNDVSNSTHFYSKSILYGAHKLWEHKQDYSNYAEDHAVVVQPEASSGNRSGTDRTYTFMIDIFNTASSVKSVLTHELAHNLGAPDHYHEEVYDVTLKKKICRSGVLCSKGLTGECEFSSPATARPATCLMNGGWQPIDNVEYDEIFCSGCEQDMQDYCDSRY